MSDQLELALVPGLTAEQERAVRRPSGSQLLAANAGSGKTRVLVERFVRAVGEDDVAPGRILAITFTERAAAELRHRVRERLIALGERDAARAVEAAFVSTIHGFCARLLRAHPLAVGIDPSFAVLDEQTAGALRREAFAEALAHVLAEGGEPALELAAAYGVEGLRAAIEETYDAQRSRGEAAPVLPAATRRHDPDRAREEYAAAREELARELGAIAEPGKSVCAALARLERAGELLARGGHPDPAALLNGVALRNGIASRYEAARLAYAAACAERLALPACGLLDQLLVAFGARFAARKRRRGALDFDDLELLAGELLAANAGLRGLWSERFELIMVDELQDTNARQLAILEALERENLLTVGDEFQSIYGFRHADVAIFRARREQLAARGAAGELSANFRARAPLLAAINAAFAPRFGEHFIPLVAGRPEAEHGPRVELLVTDREGWDEVELGATLGSGPAWRRAEARLLAQRIDDLVTAGEAQPGDVAVLLRAATDVAVYEQALADRGLPASAAAGAGFWAQAEVADLLAYAGALANPLDELALYGALASPLGGVSPDGLVLLARAAEELGRAPWEAIGAISGEDGERLAAFAERLERQRRDAARLPLDTLLSRAVYDAGYDLHLLSLQAGERRLANVHTLLRLARSFEQTEGRDLRRFADRAAAGAIATAPEAEGPGAVPGAIRLMTIHAAKGLEFPVVCVADLGRSGQADTPVLLLDGPRLGLRLRTLDSHTAVPALDYDALLAERRAAAAAEEERIMYVALTRARERLILSGAINVRSWPGPSATAPPLSWLGPALVPELPQRLLEDTEWATEHARVTFSSPASGVLREDGLSPAARAAAPAPRAAPPRMPREPGGAPAAAPPSVSYSSLSEYARCGYRYYLQRVLGLPDVEAPGVPSGVDGAARGRVVHELLEELDFAAPVVPAAERVRELLAAEGVSGGAEEVRELIAAFAASPLCARLAAAGVVRREHPFAIPLAAGEPMLSGVVDVLADAGLIVDYKSDRVGSETDLEQLVEQAYGVQRKVYALAGLRAGAPQVEVVYCFLERAREPVSATFGDAARLAEELRGLVAGLVAARFEVAANPHRGLCGTCPGRARLCSWSEERTLGE